MTVLGLILLAIWIYSLVSLIIELWRGTYKGSELRLLTVIMGLIIILWVGMDEGWFDFLSYKVF